MDLSLDLPPTADPAAAAPVHSVNAPNPTPTQSSAPSHPAYDEMITAAISALNQQNGSSKRAISNYIETNFSNLPSDHSALLTHRLKLSKDNGQVLMVKHSYTLPRSGVSAAVSVNGSASDPTAASAGPKKRPGRPPKLKSVQGAVPVFAEEPSLVDAVPQPKKEDSGLGSLYLTVEPASGSVIVGNKRGRGRPPKQSGDKLGRGRPPKSVAVATGVGRGRGRPKKNAAAAAAAARVVNLSRSRGRPRKLSNLEGGLITDGSLPVPSCGIALVAGKRRGRPPKFGGGLAKKPRNVASGEPQKPRKLGGKPLGRPKKNTSAGASQTPDNHLLMAYLDLKGKLDYFQSTIKRAVSVLKPELNTDTAVNALQELETLAAMDFSQSNVQPQS